MSAWMFMHAWCAAHVVGRGACFFCVFSDVHGQALPYCLQLFTVLCHFLKQYRTTLTSQFNQSMVAQGDAHGAGMLGET